MKIILDPNAGFCFGVRRAVDMTLRESRGEKPVFTYGPLIHNPQFIEKLRKEKDIQIINDPAEARRDTTVIIRSHGLPEDVVEKIRSKKTNLLDATCPFVQKIYVLGQKMVKEGYQVVIVGKKGHPETTAHLGNIPASILIESQKQIKNNFYFEKIGVVSQTTEKPENLQAIVDALSKKCKKIKVFNTICAATQRRQKTIKQLAKKVDLMIVVGGKNSSNTTNLKKTAEEIVKTRHIEEASEIKPKDIKNIKTIGISAGASTPDYLISEVIDRISEIFNKNEKKSKKTRSAKSRSKK